MTPAVKAVESASIEFELIEYEHDCEAPSFGEEAALMLGQPAAQVLKTLVARIDDAELVIGIVPVHCTLDLKRLAAAAGAKRARMAPPRDAERATGYVVGGISPLGQRKRLRTVIDESASSFERVFVSGGKRGLEIALAPGALQSLTRASFASIARRGAR